MLSINYQYYKNRFVEIRQNPAVSKVYRGMRPTSVAVRIFPRDSEQISVDLEADVRSENIARGAICTNSTWSCWWRISLHTLLVPRTTEHCYLAWCLAAQFQRKACCSCPFLTISGTACSTAAPAASSRRLERSSLSRATSRQDGEFSGEQQGHQGRAALRLSSVGSAAQFAGLEGRAGVLFRLHRGRER